MFKWIQCNRRESIINKPALAKLPAFRNSSSQKFENQNCPSRSLLLFFPKSRHLLWQYIYICILYTHRTSRLFKTQLLLLLFFSLIVIAITHLTIYYCIVDGCHIGILVQRVNQTNASTILTRYKTKKYI